MTAEPAGSVLLAIPVSAAAGLVSFASPCVLPLVPGYLSYVTGLSGADLAGTSDRRRVGRVLLGSVLFVLGFSVLFVSFGALFGHLGRHLLNHQAVLDRILGAVTIGLGVVFLGLVPGLQREVRLRRVPTVGIAGAPLLGIVFGLGWTPCIGPTLGAVVALEFQGGTSTQGALLAFVYCLGLGLPFILGGLLYQRALGVFGFLRRHALWVLRFGGGLLIVVGVLLVTGLWTHFSNWLLHLYPGYSTPL